jgi:hypothetical protein
VSRSKRVTLQNRHCAGRHIRDGSDGAGAGWVADSTPREFVPILGGVRDVRLRKSSSPPRSRSKPVRWEVIKLQASPARMIGVVSAVDEEEARAAAIVQ